MEEMLAVPVNRYVVKEGPISDPLRLIRGSTFPKLQTCNTSTMGEIRRSLVTVAGLLESSANMMKIIPLLGNGKHTYVLKLRRNPLIVVSDAGAFIPKTAYRYPI